MAGIVPLLPEGNYLIRQSRAAQNAQLTCSTLELRYYSI